MLERMWRKGNPNTLLVGMQTGEATVENSTEFSQKPKIGTAFIPQPGLYPKILKHQSKSTYAPNVHSSTIYNSQVLEATKVPISK